MVAKIGRFEVIRHIADGGMGSVLLARTTGVGGFERLVAIKMMHPSLVRNEPEAVAMFLDEARLAARIRHANVVATHDVQQQGEELFLLMDYVEGATLRSIIRKMVKGGEQVPVAVALRIMVDCLAGLHAAHEVIADDGEPLQLVHRDVSPHNILVGTDGVSRLTDFGVAKAEARLSSTRHGQMKGKLIYMSPEQLLDNPVDRRSDVYSAGAVLWEALAGRQLFRGSNEGAILHRILEGASEPPSAYHADVPASVDRVCLKALAREASDRFPSAEALGRALHTASSEVGVSPAQRSEVATYVRGLSLHIDPAALSQSGSTLSPANAVFTAATVEEQGPQVSATEMAATTRPDPQNGEVSTRMDATRTSDVILPKKARPALPRAILVAVLAVGAGAIGWGLRATGPTGLEPALRTSAEVPAISAPAASPVPAPPSATTSIVADAPPKPTARTVSRPAPVKPSAPHSAPHPKQPASTKPPQPPPVTSPTSTSAADFVPGKL